MKKKHFGWVAQIGVLLLAVCMGAMAQTPKQMNFRGSISDFTSASGGGPWEMGGLWSLKVKGDSGKADFSAALTMVRSDLGVSDLNSPAMRNAHTHHITVVNAIVTPIANGFRVSGTATVTANGNYPPPFGQSSTLQIDIVGGNSVAFSNIKLTFGGDAVKHFGSQAINGVVRSVESESH